ncbi:MAG: hypothetical protein RL432_126 [Bacteroidota bacterium]|jgi:hypothetical protein
MKNIIIVSIITFLLISCNAEISKPTKNRPHKQSVGAGEDFIRSISKEQEREILHLIQLFESQDTNGIVDRVAYPFDRDYPIPAIENKEQMRARFSEVFDEKLMEEIASSNADDWSTVGWRGIMLDQGIVWLSDDASLISGINYQTLKEKAYQKQLIADQKAHVHESIAMFERPELLSITDRFLVRIDQMPDHSFRYASWKKGKSQTEQPDLVLTDGTVESSGTGGNHVFSFKTGIYTYNVYRNLLGEGDYSEINLEVLKSGDKILFESGKLINVR